MNGILYELCMLFVCVCFVFEMLCELGLVVEYQGVFESIVQDVIEFEELIDMSFMYVWFEYSLLQLNFELIVFVVWFEYQVNDV